MPTSQQVNNLTSSTNGGNIQAKLQPKSHFFIEGAAFSQSQNQAFGPLSTTEFRTTAKISITGTKQIFAICRGQVFIQPQSGTGSDPNKINLILRPFTQPIQGLAVKYFIYRGLDKANFVSGNNVAAPSMNGFTQMIWDQFNNFHAGENPMPDFSAHFLGMPYTGTGGSNQAPTDYIDQYFNKITSVTDVESGEEDQNTTFELPIVPRGTDFGAATGDIGLDIVLDHGEYYLGYNNPVVPLLDLAYAGAPDSVLDTANLTNPSQYELKLFKEACTQFIDPAAFYGLHANGAGELFMDLSTTPLTSASDIYNKLAGFHTKNNIYLYIQANRQRSYHFYENYEHSDGNTNTLNIGGTDLTMSETTFGTHGWPIHIFTEAQDPNTAVNTLCMQLTTDSYSNAALFVKTGFLTSGNETSFVRGDNLLEVPSTDPNITVDTNYTKYIQFETPSEGADTIGCLFELIYEGKQLLVEEHFATPPADPVYHTLKDIDDVFGLIDAESFKVTQEDGALPTVIDEKLQLINFPIEGSQNDIGVIRTKKVEDKIQTVDETTFLERITYETLLSKIRYEPSSFIKSSSPSTDIATAKTQDYNSKNSFYEPHEPYFQAEHKFNVDSISIAGIGLGISNNDLISKRILGITKSENDTLKSLISANSYSNPKLFFLDLHMSSNDKFTSDEGIPFKSYNVVISAEDNLGEIKIFKPVTEIIIYSLDNYLFFSREYSNYFPSNDVYYDFDLNDIIIY